MADAIVDVELKAKIDKASKEFSKFAKNTQKQYEKVGKTLDTAFKVFAGGFVLQQFARAFKAPIDAAIRQEEAINNLNIAIGRTGEFSQEASLGIQKWASEIEKSTRIGDEAAIEAFNFAKSMNITNEAAKQATDAAIELSAATGKSLQESIRQVAKTFGGFAGELGEVSPEIKKLTAEELKAGAAAEVLLSQFGGSAAKQVNTFGGAMDQLGNAFGTLLENMGGLITGNGSLVGSIQFVSKAIASLADFVKRNGDRIVFFFKAATVAATAFFLALKRGAIGSFLKTMGSVALILPRLVLGLKVGAAAWKVFWASATVGLSLALVGILELADKMGGLANVVKQPELAFQIAWGNVKLFTLDLIQFIIKAFSKIPFIGKKIEGMTAGVMKSLDGMAKSAKMSLANADKQLVALGITSKETGDSFNKNLGGGNIKKAALELSFMKKEFKEITTLGAALSKNLKPFLQGKGIDITFGLSDLQLDLSKVEDQLAKATEESEKKRLESLKTELTARIENSKKGAEIINGALMSGLSAFTGGLTKGGLEGAQSAVVGIAKATGDALGTMLAGIPLGDAIGPFIELAVQGADKVKESFTSFFKELPNVLASLYEGLNAIPEALVQSAPIFIQSLINSIPRLIQAALSQGPVLLQAVLEAIPQIITALVELLPEVLISFLDSIPTIVEGFIFSIIDQIPILIESLITAIPRLTQNLIAQIPLVVARIIAVIPRIAINMITELVKLFPMMVTMLVKNLIEQTPKLIVEIVKSMGDAIVKILSDFFGGIGSEKGFLGTGLLSSEGLLGIKGIPILQEGGMVRGKGSQHGLAAIQAGEFVVDRADTSRLVDFLNQNDRIGGLDQVIQRLEEGGTGGGVIEVNVMVGEEQLAQTLVNLNKQGFRTA